MMIKSLLIILALRMQFPPFVWVFRFYYWLAIRCVIRRLRSMTGVKSVYLSGSLARQDVTYGLSDIDFKILVAGKKDKTVYQLIQNTFAGLRRIFPMLGPPAEKGIYFLEDFAADYACFPLLQHQFDERFYRHELLWGVDLIKQLPLLHWSQIDQPGTFSWRLKDCVEKVHILAGHPQLTNLQQHNLLTKAIGDVMLLVLRLRQPSLVYQHREAILEEAAAGLPGADGELLHRISQEKPRRYRGELVNLNEKYRLFKRMVNFCAIELGGECEAVDTRLAMPVEMPASVSVPSLEVIEEIKRLSPAIGDVHVFPWVQLPLDPLDMHFFGKQTLLVSCTSPIELPDLVSLRRHYRDHLLEQGVLLLEENQACLLSIYSELLDHWTARAGADDMVERLLNQTGFIKIGSRQRNAINTRLDSFMEQLRDMLTGYDIGRMDRRMFLPFMFNAIRTLIFAQEFRKGRVVVTPTAQAVLEYLRKQTPLSPEYLNLLEKEYCQVMDQGRELDERLAVKLRRLLECTFKTVQEDREWGELGVINSLPDKARLSISLAVATRNRPAQLKRCLTSILQQTRPPDELVIVDSSDDDSSHKIVNSFAYPFRMKLETTVPRGVAEARNQALNLAGCEIIASIDDDTIADPDLVYELENVFLRDPRIGIAGGSILNLKREDNDLLSRFMEVIEKL